MLVSIASLCEEVRFREDGRVDVVGAAPDQVVVAGLPWKGQLTFALVLELGPGDDLTRMGMNVSVVRAADGSVVGTVDPGTARQPRHVPAGEEGPVHVPFELHLASVIREPGVYRVVVLAPSGEELATASFMVRTRG